MKDLLYGLVPLVIVIVLVGLIKYWPYSCSFLACLMRLW